MKGAGLSGHLELPKPSRELIGVKSHDELQMLLLVRLVWWSVPWPFVLAVRRICGQRKNEYLASTVAAA